MDASDYLVFSAVDLVEVSRKRRNSESQITVIAKKRRQFYFFFAKSSQISRFLSGKHKVGNCKVFLSGKLLLGPRLDAFIASLALLVLVAFQVCSSVTFPLLYSASGWDFAMALTVSFLLIFSIIMMLLTGLTNPGIVPKEPTTSLSAFPVPRFLLLNGVCVRQKFCRTCRIYRPPRSNHCSVCDNCVLRHDHHCAALGTCVGLGNYRWFLLLSGSLALLSPLVFFLVKNQILALALRNGDISYLDFVSNNFMLMFTAILSLVASVAFLLLFVYHYFITTHNLTTNEHLKKYYKVNPFDYGKLVNVKHVICFPQELLPIPDTLDVEASYRELASTNSECVSDFYDY